MLGTAHSLGGSSILVLQRPLTMFKSATMREQIHTSLTPKKRQRLRDYIPAGRHSKKPELLELLAEPLRSVKRRSAPLVGKVFSREDMIFSLRANPKRHIPWPQCARNILSGQAPVW